MKLAWLVLVFQCAAAATLPRSTTFGGSITGFSGRSGQRFMARSRSRGKARGPTRREPNPALQCGMAPLLPNRTSGPAGSSPRSTRSTPQSGRRSVSTGRDAERVRLRCRSPRNPDSQVKKTRARGGEGARVHRRSRRRKEI